MLTYVTQLRKVLRSLTPAFTKSDYEHENPTRGIHGKLLGTECIANNLFAFCDSKPTIPKHLTQSTVILVTKRNSPETTMGSNQSSHMENPDTIGRSLVGVRGRKSNSDTQDYDVLDKEIHELTSFTESSEDDSTVQESESFSDEEDDGEWTTPRPF
mmetsp:Transcript_15327/g.23345  ORF Transcript_15327/g.23345 Transcript_15327/m.23345 type:complete len:157 (+) Transcript_15327:799-1269(+)